MENNEAVDDQNSGWFEVKKKHRNTSKSSLQSCDGGRSGKNASNSLRSQRSINKNDRDSHAMLRSHLPRMEENFVRNSGSVTNSMSGSKEEECTCHLNTNVVKYENQSHKSHADDSRGAHEVIEKLPQNSKSEVIQKIKWGDLEDYSFPLPHENLSGSGIKFGTIGDDNMLNCRKTGSVFDAVLSDSSHAKDNVPVAKVVDSDMTSNQIPSLESKDEISVENGIEVKGTSSEGILPLNEKEINQADDTSNFKSENDAGVKTLTDNGIDNDVGIVEVPQTNCNSVSAVTDQSTLHVPECGLEIAGDFATSVEDVRVTQSGNVGGILSSSHNMNALEEGNSNESKERFRQRLWCFLFENLNRSVDELYLLCELECDLEQMKEAILVLEEAASDFKELINRVEEFDKVKKSSQIIDGVPVILKSDHRRTHALSWEVRRMTSSPHKADILSSSLEAFRRIQQERASLQAINSAENVMSKCPTPEFVGNLTKSVTRPRKQDGSLDANEVHLTEGKHNVESGKPCKAILEQNGQSSQPKSSLSSKVNLSDLHPRQNLGAVATTKSKREHVESEAEKLKKDNVPMEGITDNSSRSMDDIRRQIPIPEKDKEKRNVAMGKSMNAWKEKRNWEDILSSPFRVSSRVSYSPGLNRKSAERVRILHDKLMSPDKKKKTTSDLRKEAEEKHARAMRIRNELENERVQKLQRTSEKLNRVNEWQAVRNMKLREGLYARHQRSESRHEAYLAQVVKRAGDESSKVNEVRFITSLNEENKKLILRQKLHGSELRRAEKLQVIKSRQKEDLAREEAVLERRKLIEAEKLQRLAEIQRKKEEAQVRREEERKASSAAREARAIEQLRRKEERAKAQQEEAELLAQKLAERLSESEQRRKVYLEQIRERASMDFRDQSSPLLRRSGQSRSTPTNSSDDPQTNISSTMGGSSLGIGNIALQHSMKRRIKKIRQRLMALKHEFLEPSLGGESAGIGYRVAVGAAKAKVGRWLQELQRLRQARKEGATSIGLIIAEMIKYLEGKDPELQASRQVGLLDFIASALPASHTSKPEACQVTLHLSKLLRVVLSVHANRSYFLAQNFLPPIIPMLSAALENYIKIAASINIPGNPSLPANKVSVESFELICEILNNFLWTVTTILGHASSEERQLQMRDGLLELLISYQVIHRLRDLFALHDRPQMEGSSFPTPILLSIHLLVTLTSRHGTISSIDWNSFPTVKEQKIENEGAQAADSIHSVVSNSWGDYRSPLSLINGGSVMHLPDVPEDRPLDESCKVNVSDESLAIDRGHELRQIDGSLQLKNTDVEVTSVPDESKSNQRGDIINSCVSQKDEKNMVVGAKHKSEKVSILDQPVEFLLSALSETGLVSLLSLLTAVLLQANNRSSSEQTSFILPSNFDEVAAGVLKVLNNVALLDLAFLQQMLARPDLKMEIFHLMSFLLSHCTSKWKASDDQVGILMLESLSLLGHFALFHPSNQAVLRWGKSPTILHKVCDLPFVFFSDPELMPFLAATLIAACYGCEQNKFVVQQELNVDMLLSLLRSCKNASYSSQFNSTSDSSPADESNEQNQVGSEFRKPHMDVPIKYIRTNGKGTRNSLGKSGALGNGIKTSKTRSQKDSKAIKNNEEVASKSNLYLPEASSLMLHCRFPNSFIDKAEQFFSAEIPSGIVEVQIQT